MRRLYVCLLSILATAAGGSPSIAAPPAASACKADAGWNDPAKPRRVFGNTWYVGTCGISALLITSDKGHVLIDGATKEAGPQIEGNIRALGFRIKDVRFILATHAHLDHAGGFARLQRDSGAVMVARGADADAIERGPRRWSTRMPADSSPRRRLRNSTSGSRGNTQPRRGKSSE